MAKIKRKLWVSIFGKYNFRDVVYTLCPKYNIEVLIGFKPDMMVDMHLGLKGEKEDIENLRLHLVKKGHRAVSRKTKEGWQFSFDKKTKTKEPEL